MSTNTTPEPFRIYGNLSLLEMAPILLAAQSTFGAPALIRHGGVMNLWGEGSDLASLSSTGEADVAANSETQTLRGALRHPDLRVILTVAECPYRIVARRSAGITCLADLAGKRIGSQLDSSAAYFLERLLATAGLRPDDVACVPFMAKTAAPLTLVPDALKVGTLDAVALWEPQVQRAQILLGADAIEFIDPDVYTEKFNLSTRQAHLDDPRSRGRIVAFVRAVVAASRQLRADPIRAQALVAKTAGLEPELVRSAWPHFAYRGALASDLLDVFARQDAWIARLDGREPRSRSALAALIDGSVLREALAT